MTRYPVPPLPMIPTVPKISNPTITNQKATLMNKVSTVANIDSIINAKMIVAASSGAFSIGCSLVYVYVCYVTAGKVAKR